MTKNAAKSVKQVLQTYAMKKGGEEREMFPVVDVVVVVVVVDSRLFCSLEGGKEA